MLRCVLDKNAEFDCALDNSLSNHPFEVLFRLACFTFLIDSFSVLSSA